MLQPEERVALYRVAQEALTNIERHAEASSVSIRFSTSGDRMRMEIADNGRGFAPRGVEKGAKPATGLGLRNMEERMTHFGGRLDVESSSRGTVLRAMLPITAAKDEAADLREAAA